MLSQVVTNTLITAGAYLLVASGFGLIFRTVRFFHFAHGLVFAVGAYGLLFWSRQVGMPFLVSIVLSMGTATILGCLMEIFVYRPLRRRSVSPLILLMASLGIYIVGQNLLSMYFGDDLKSVEWDFGHEGFNFLGGRVTGVQLTTIGVSLIVTAILMIVLYLTALGKHIRAVANDPSLCEIVGINADFVTLLVFAIGSATAAVGGILVGLDVYIQPTMGMTALFGAVVVMIMGGSGSLGGAVLAALVLALTKHLCVSFISSKWEDAIVFLVLVLFLIFRPQGFFGTPLKQRGV